MQQTKVESTGPTPAPTTAEQIEAAREKVALKYSINKEHACVGCVFKGRTCGSSGPVDSPFVIVGESPGKNEIAKGLPFIGESGELLRSILRRNGYSAEYPEPYITNAIKCWPGHKKDQGSLANACRACRANLMAEINAHPREVILALGAGALWSLTGDFRAKITQVRGTIFPSPLAKHGIVASVHPAFLLRGGGSLPKFRSDVALATEIVRKIQRPKYIPSREVIIRSEHRFSQLVRGLINRAKRNGIAPTISTDIETAGFRALEDDILCYGIGWKPHVAYVIPEHLVACTTSKLLLEQPSDTLKFLWHNGKFDVQFFHRVGIEARVDEDLMLCSYVLDENKGLHDLEQVSNDAVGAPNWKGMLDQYLPNRKSSYRVIPRDVLHKYLGKDVSATLQAFSVLKSRVREKPKLLKAYEKVLIPASKFLAQVETNGIKIDKQKNAENQVRLTDEMAAIQKELDEFTMTMFNHKVNINSPIQVATLLFDEIGLTFDGKKSTAKDVLEALPPHPAVNLVLRYRKAAKAKGTYVDNLYERPRYGKRGNILGYKPGHVQRDGRVHATYLIHGTVTGRLSSRKPNLQNIPRDPFLRGQFCADEGNLLYEVDLNQAELRCLAELSGDPGLMAIYMDPEHPGLHHEVSVTLFGPNYTGEHKMRAKAVNFGIVYGRTGASLADEFNLSSEEGDRWVSGWFKRFPLAGEFIQECRAAPTKGLALFTPFGRMRRFGIVNRQNRQSVENEASNFLHQSIASDITLVANAKAVEDPKYDGLPVNVIHDAGLHETLGVREHVLFQAALVQRYMEEEPKLWGLTKVPFKADIKLGKYWGYLKSPSKYEW
jgi:uracil-DNA glycosylase family 4